MPDRLKFSRRMRSSAFKRAPMTDAEASTAADDAARRRASDCSTGTQAHFTGAARNLVRAVILLNKRRTETSCQIFQNFHVG